MEIKITEKGKARGTISVAATLVTMEIGDSWDILCDIIPITRARAYASSASRLLGRWYTVKLDREHSGKYTITRTR